ncbi:MAG TPA: ParB/RepB/Spo0J family partition protein [Thermoleophilaceae bacterium]|nr:ParB/RepB/Spo0J family partition protein [Thermoleophilaceae bacterium]
MPEAWQGVSAGTHGRGIGRGLAAILAQSEREADGLRHLALDVIRPNPRQPRRAFDQETLLGLAESIKACGVLQPLVVRPLAGGDYELVAGERRLRAARLAGLDEIPAVVRETAEAEQLELALVENVAREDLNPVEEARACATLVEDLGVSKEELGRRIGRSRVAVSNLIRLLDLPDDVLAMLAESTLSEGHGRAILMCRDQGARRRLARAAAAAGWSVRETESRAKQEDDGSARTPGREPIALHPDLADALAAAEDALTAALGREVRVRPRRGAYRVELELENPHEGVELAERILRRAAA